MVQGYYTLEEAAGHLGISSGDLKSLARKGEIRSFQDRGTWRFRIQDIQEMARRTGKGSDPELPLGESLVPKPTDSPAPKSPTPQRKTTADSPPPRSPTPQKKPADEVFGFALDSGKEMGVDLAADADAEVNKKGGKKGSSKRSPVGQAGSDSDVRLVADGRDVNPAIPVDSDVKVVQDSGPKSGPRSGTAPQGPKSPRSSKLQPPGKVAADPPDSGVRLVPIDSDSDVRIVGAGSDEYDVVGGDPPKGTTDSDIRLEGHFPAPTGKQGEGLLTEEINLDEELKKDEAQREAQMQQAKLRPKEPQFPKTSPFELSETGLGLPDDELGVPEVKDAKEDTSSDFDLTPAKEKDPSSDFDLTPAGESSSPLELGSSDDFRLEVPDEDDGATLADDGSVNLKGPRSGINLGKPADSGISLEQGGEASEEIEFSLSLDAESTPKPQTPKPAAAPSDSDSDSEFELSLDLEKSDKTDSDSEFELTLDDSGALEALEPSAPAAKKGKEKDIFETDFEVPGLEEESGSDAVVMEDADTDLESSDFELAIDHDDAGELDESGSMVVPLDEEEAVDDAAETVTAKSRQKKQAGKQRKKTKAARAAEMEAEVDAEGEAAGFADLEGAEPLAEAEAEVDEDEELVAAADTGPGRVIRETVVIQQAPWGIFPTLVLLPCVVVMVLLGIMGFELVQQQQGYRPGVLTKAIGGIIDKK
jgi:excisionase family DNA binding protein